MTNRWRLCVFAAVTILISILAVPGALATPGFSDVPQSHPYYSSIQKLASLGAVTGFPDGSFRPDGFVTRQQMAKIVVTAVGKHTEAVDNQSHPTFSDMTPDMGLPYPFDFVEEAAASGMFVGSGGKFNPDANISRIQLALVLVRAGGSNLATPPAGYQAGFTDVPGYALAEVTKAKFNGLLNGKTATTFDPWANATRGQVAKMTATLVDKLAKGSVNGVSETPTSDFTALATRLNAILALGYNTTNPDVVAKVLFDKNAANDPVILDTREAADFAKGHIPGAVNIPLMSLPQALLDGDSRIPMNKEVVIASYWGDDGNLANVLVNIYRIIDPVAQKAAIDAKTTPPYPKSTVLFQGMTAWSFARDLVPANTRFEDALKAGITVQKPVVAGTIAGIDQKAYPTFTDFGTDDLIRQALLRARSYFNRFASQFDIQVYPSALAANLEDGNAANDPQVISVRNATDYVKGHIPTAINIPYQKVADVANFTKFVDVGRPVVAYCYTGHTGGIATMALGILGYDVRNLLYGINGWNPGAPGAGQLKNFDLMKAWDFPVVTGKAGDLPSLADYVAPTGCEGCHASLTGIFYDREVANPIAAGAAPPSEGEG